MTPTGWRLVLVAALCVALVVFPSWHVVVVAALVVALQALDVFASKWSRASSRAETLVEEHQRKVDAFERVLKDHTDRLNDLTVRANIAGTARQGPFGGR